MFTCWKEIFKCASVNLGTQAEAEAWSAWLNIKGPSAISIYLWDSQLVDKSPFNCGSVYRRSQAAHQSLYPGQPGTTRLKRNRGRMTRNYNRWLLLHILVFFISGEEIWEVNKRGRSLKVFGNSHLFEVKAESTNSVCWAAMGQLPGSEALLMLNRNYKSKYFLSDVRGIRGRSFVAHGGNTELPLPPLLLPISWQLQFSLTYKKIVFAWKYLQLKKIQTGHKNVRSVTHHSR